MTTYTIYGDTADGYIVSYAATYANARAGSGTLEENTSGTLDVGQFVIGDYYCYESFISFDTSSITDSETVSAATLSIYGFFDYSTTNFTVNARTRDWGASLTTGDWVAGASVSANTLLATFASAGFSASGYNAFTSEVAMLAAVNKTGTTRMMLSSSRHEGNNTPGGDESLSFLSADESGTTTDPKLVVEAAAAGGGFPFRLNPIRAHIVR